MTTKNTRGQEIVTVAINKSQFDSLICAIEKLAKAVVAAQIKDIQDTKQKVRFLRVFGFTENEIAGILGKTRQRVGQILKGK